MEGSVIEDVGGRRGAHGENLERFDLVEGELGLEHDGVDAFFGAVLDGGRGVVDPCLAANGVRGG